jgi:arginyl-tRNA synthetase
VRALRAGEPLPEEAYRGAYVADLAAELPDEVWARATSRRRRRRDRGRLGIERVRAGIEASLEHLGVHFDVWKTEGSLHREGLGRRAIARLGKSRHV